MKYADFEKIMSSKRMERYLTACGGDTRKAMTLYRYNLQISQEMFTKIRRENGSKASPDGLIQRINSDLYFNGNSGSSRKHGAYVKLGN